MSSRFEATASRIARIAGGYASFLTACAVVLIWAASGPIFAFSDTWQLVINTGTTVVTFLMVFLIQNTQNRDTRAMHLKLDELIRVTERADDALIMAEEDSEDQLNSLRRRDVALAEAHRALAEEHRSLEQRSGARVSPEGVERSPGRA